ncbi:replication-relaxation family protein [uncultured Roseobacter sp.]|uniref:replication-relaxation family protein n=1 Tax=uncultured Roseobacter sp. TaxID=114847 RepID=UPI0026019155|nr:replication-relaxation family protein [uncultured Roseobacter sp.]
MKTRTQSDISVTARELRWFAHIDRHGPQSSEFLFELTRDTHRCRDTSLRRLQTLRAAGYLRLPPQQKQIAKADFNPYVYDLTPLGWDRLSCEQELERHCRPTGHWWHGYWVSAVSNAIEIAAIRAGLEYIPASMILAIKNAPLAIPVGRHKLIPDQLFAIKYPEGYRAFTLEIDRGTEPVRSAAARKSLQKSVAQYRELLQQKLHQKHYGLKSNLAVLWMFTSAKRRLQFNNLLNESDQQFLLQYVSMPVPKYDELSRSIRCVVSG